MPEGYFNVTGLTGSFWPSWLILGHPGASHYISLGVFVFFCTSHSQALGIWTTLYKFVTNLNWMTFQSIQPVNLNSNNVFQIIWSTFWYFFDTCLILFGSTWCFFSPHVISTDPSWPPRPHPVSPEERGASRLPDQDVGAGLPGWQQCPFWKEVTDVWSQCIARCFKPHVWCMVN